MQFKIFTWPTVVLLCLIGISGHAVGQKKSAPAAKPSTNKFPLVQVNISGSNRYSNTQILSALGLRTGQTIVQKDLEDASARLGSTGLFSLVKFRFGMVGSGVVANFDVADNTELVPVFFENFIWFTPNELATQLKTKLSLFTGVVPLTGDFREQVADALQQIIAARHLAGTVASLPQGSLNSAPQAMLFRVEGNDIRIASCDFTSTEHADASTLAEITNATVNSSYERSNLAPLLHSRLKNMYDLYGYLGAQFDEPEIKIVSESPDRTLLAISTRVKEGPQYKLAGINWSGNRLHSNDELNKALHPDFGQVASLPKFNNNLTRVRALYGKDGYIGLRVSVDPQLDGSGAATFNITLTEGVQYAMGDLQINGLDPEMLAKVLSDWNMKAGNVYDDSYPSFFMMSRLRRFVPVHLMWEWRKREVIHDDNKTVDLLIELQLKPRNNPPLSH